MDFKYLKHLAKRGAAYIHPKGYEATKTLIDKLKIRSGDKILEFGCGTGATLCNIAVKYDVTLEAVDVLDEMAQTASERVKLLGLDKKVSVHKLNNSGNLPFENSFFDKIYMESVIGFQSIEDMQKILDEIKRVLKNDGLIAINEAFWKDGIDDFWVKNIAEELTNDFGLSHASQSNITIKKFKKISEERGLKVQEIINLESPASQNLFSVKNGKFEKRKRKKAIISPGYLFDEIKFRYRMKKHASFAGYIESYIIVMNKIWQ